MSHHIEEQELLSRIAALPREIRPQNDPWPAISARLEQPGRHPVARRFPRQWAMSAAAAAVVLALVAGWFVGPRLAERTLPSAGSETALHDGPIRNGKHRLPVILEASEAEYQAAFREFIAVGQAKPNLSPHTIATLESSWADLRETESALAAALAVNPDDRFLNDRMFELRARQLGFLQELASLDQNNRRLTI